MKRSYARAFASVVAAVLITGVAAGCSAEDSPTNSGTPGGSASALSGELKIFAAASLTASFDQLAAEFVKQNPGVTIGSVDYDGSSTLVTQLVEGASADVFASADETNMKKLSDAGLLSGSSSVFAGNTLEIVVGPGNPKKIETLADLADKKLLVVLCAPEVPCGTASAELLALDGVKVTPVSEEQNVKAVVTKISTGEADAGLVYRTDVKAAGSSVEGIDVVDAGRVVSNYTIGVPTAAKNPAVAAAFISWVLSDKGQAILADYGFAKP